MLPQAAIHKPHRGKRSLHCKRQKDPGRQCWNKVLPIRTCIQCMGS